MTFLFKKKFWYFKPSIYQRILSNITVFNTDGKNKYLLSTKSAEN